MKTRMFLIMGLAMMVVMACGKSADQLKAETDLNAKVMKLHDDLMAMQKDLDGLDGQLDAAAAKHEELAKDKTMAKKIGDHKANDIAAAMGQIAAAKEAMSVWMTGFKKYDPKKPHEEVMKQLKADEENLTKVKTDMEGASTAAKSAIEVHAKFAESLKTKKGK
jgi:hypothetical protein